MLRMELVSRWDSAMLNPTLDPAVLPNSQTVPILGSPPTVRAADYVGNPSD